MNNIKIHSKDDLSEIVWPKNQQSQKAKAFLIPLLENGVNSYIKNIETDLYVIIINDKVLPLTVNNNSYETNSYVVSPYCNFILYAIKELKKLNRPLLEAPLRLLLFLLGKIFKVCAINRVAIINNWMLSTNMFPSLSKEEFVDIIDHVKSQFPNHTVYIRCVSHMDNNPIYKAMSKLNLTKIISRPVYYQEPKNISYSSSPSIKTDRKAFNKSNYKLLRNSEIPSNLLPQLRDIYFKLYIKKYSTYNPQFTQKFFEEVVTSIFFEPYVLVSPEGSVDAGGVFYQVGNTITTPILGYDTDMPSKKGLYRLATYQTFDIAKKENLTINRSSGAPHFKRCRKAQQVIEYNYVDLSGLPLTRKLPWLILNIFINPLALFIFKFFKL